MGAAVRLGLLDFIFDRRHAQDAVGNACACSAGELSSGLVDDISTEKKNGLNA